VGIATDKIDFLMRNMVFFGDVDGDIFPPTLGGFGVIDPGTSQKLKAEVLRMLINFDKTKAPVAAEGDFNFFPIF
jgi:hypothetical protein